MNLNNQTISALTRAIFERLQSSGLIPRFVQATTVETGTTPTVVINGTTDQIQANALADPAGVGEVVWCVQWLGTTLVVGRAGGTRLMGSASTSIDQSGITTATDLNGLSVDVVVTQPGRELHIWGQVQAMATTSSGDVIGRIQQDGVTIGRFGRWRALSINQPQLMVGMARVQDLSPGGYTFNLDLECQTAGSVTAANATTPGIIWVEDAGAVP